ncbi:hypothetical protein [Chitinophaga ginsengisegetis]|uniref:hypothetical protein n=1 Tax=Chitinophaga ginsengisegetis TaxID=393003 RepID=UPI000DC024C4|nr:hypothetical protein [Chitinophaga ginsengisegetis]MDR6566557.1 hypothetical protein [Chitinophaga ginsengisegetis]MDR6646287.1 hypothetical protein [Chitinophaga ginsengisegetis]MDR6651120.1 hypothetical protein [Chitinophaga ginsengisegetis]
MTFLLLPDDNQIYTIKIYLRLILYLFVPGIFIYILINIFNVPHLTYVRADKREYENYYFLYYSLSTVHFRFFSIFDEPGVVGSLSAMVVMYYRKFLSKREYIAFICAGFLSFSLFFIVTFPIIYYFSDIRYIPYQKRVKKLFTCALILVVFYFSFILAITQFINNPIIQFGIYNRFKWENGLIVGMVNNRDILPGFDESYTSFVERNEADLWLGKGKNSVADEFGASGLSYRISIYEKGILIVLYMLGLIILMHPWHRQFIFSLVSVIFILMLLFQRTLFFKIDYFSLLFIGSGIITKYAKKENSTYNTEP